MRNGRFIFPEALCEWQVISFLLLARCFSFWQFILCRGVDLFEFILLRFHRGSGCRNHVFFQICEVFGQSLFRHPSCPFPSSHSRTPGMRVRTLDSIPEAFEVLFIFLWTFFSLHFRFEDFYGYVFKFIDSSAVSNLFLRLLVNFFVLGVFLTLELVFGSFLHFLKIKSPCLMRHCSYSFLWFFEDI